MTRLQRISLRLVVMVLIWYLCFRTVARLERAWFTQELVIVALCWGLCFGTFLVLNGRFLLRVRPHLLRIKADKPGWWAGWIRTSFSYRVNTFLFRQDPGEDEEVRALQIEGRICWAGWMSLVFIVAPLSLILFL